MKHAEMDVKYQGSIIVVSLVFISVIFFSGFDIYLVTNIGQG